MTSLKHAQPQCRTDNYALLISRVVLLVFILGLVALPAAWAQSYNVVYSFDGSVGSLPLGKALLDDRGNLYGTASAGGSNQKGTVFKVSPSGTATLLYSFTGGADGGAPEAGLIADEEGNLYGTAAQGGYTGGRCGGVRSGCGVVFKLSKSGVENVLYAFRDGPDGDGPYHELVRDAAGNLYGTTTWGGVLGGICGTFGCGVAFKLDRSGHETVLHAFTGGADGWLPNSALLLDAEGNVYGTAAQGGIFTGQDCSSRGCGVIYKIDAAGKYSVLYSFTGGFDGLLPWTLISDSNGNFYGCTIEGAASDEGTIFELSNSGELSVLYTFGTHSIDFGCGGLLRNSDGTLYGTTKYATGTIFKLDTSGNYSEVYRFKVSAGGFDPNVPTLDSQGNLHGTTYTGGNPQCHGCGVVYELTP
jgi:uncharacterized repeat protein (TIGR03803 family)